MNRLTLIHNTMKNNTIGANTFTPPSLHPHALAWVQEHHWYGDEWGLLPIEVSPLVFNWNRGMPSYWESRTCEGQQGSFCMSDNCILKQLLKNGLLPSLSAEFYNTELKWKPHHRFKSIGTLKYLYELTWAMQVLWTRWETWFPRWLGSKVISSMNGGGLIMGKGARTASPKRPGADRSGPPAQEDQTTPTSRHQQAITHPDA